MTRVTLAPGQCPMADARRMRRGWLCGALLWLTLAVAADERVPWTALTPDEQQLLSTLRGEWDTLPVERQQHLRRGAARWATLAPDERAFAAERLQRWRQIDPARRALIRERYERYKALPPARQARLREVYARFRQLPPAERRALPLWPASALATAALLLVMLRGNLAHLPGSGETALDAELIGSATELELLEDLEFYEWLDADGAAG